jgi:hypothetical protein
MATPSSALVTDRDLTFTPAPSSAGQPPHHNPPLKFAIAMASEKYADGLRGPAETQRS